MIPTLIITIVVFLLAAAALSLTVVVGNRKPECSCKKAARVLKQVREREHRDREEFLAKMCAGCPGASPECQGECPGEEAAPAIKHGR